MKMMDSSQLIEYYLSLLKRWKWPLLLLTFLLIAGASAGLKNLSFMPGYKVFFASDDPQLLAFDRFQNIYTDTLSALVVVEPRNSEVFTPDTLKAVAEITASGWKLPYATRVDSITNFQYSHANGDDLTIENLLPDASHVSSGEAERIKQIALNEPLLHSRLVSADGKVTAVNIGFQIKSSQPGETAEAVAALRALSRKIEAAYPGIYLHLTGPLILNHSFAEASQHDLEVLMPLMLVVIIVLLWMMTGSFVATMVTTAIIAVAVLATLGLTSWIGISLTSASAAAPPIIMTISVANSIHLLTHALHARSHGRSQEEAIDDSLRANIGPIALTNLTTCISFLTMNFSDSPPFQDLGNIVAIGVNVTFVVTAVALPILLTLLPLNPREEKLWGAHTLSRITEFAMRRNQLVLAVVGTMALTLMAFIPRNELNDDYVKYFSESSSFRQATEFTAARLTGVTNMEYSMDSRRPDGVNDPQFLQKIEDFANWLRQQPEVVHIFSLTDILKRLNMNMHADEKRYYALPDQREMTAQYLLLYEMSLPVGLDLRNIINTDRSATRLTASFKNLSTNQLLEFEQRAAHWLDTHGLSSADIVATGPDVMFSHISNSNMNNMLQGTVWEIISITTILIIALRSFSLGLLSVVPNLIPAACAFGVWGLLMGEVNLAVSVVTGMTLGIIIDDTVHFLSAYRKARHEQQLAVPEAIRATMGTVGNAMLITTVILACGFAVLIFSTYEATAWMGMLTSLTILLALVTEVLLMPALLMLGQRKG